MRRSLLPLAVLVTIVAAACTGGDDETPTATPEVNASPAATAPPTASAAPTGAPLGTADIYALVAPAIAFIDTPLGTGSAILIHEEWLVTNAHVVWPYERVRAVFGDGTEFIDAEVYAWDLIADLAVIRLPAGHGIPAVTFADPRELPTGSELFLIGYPAENEDFPQAAISGGVLSRFREWESAGLTYVQTDAAITGGQSGGALVSEAGQVVGLSGFKFADTFALALAAPILEERTQDLINDSGTNQLSERRLASSTSSQTLSFSLENYYDEQAFIIRQAVGTTIELELVGLNDVILTVYDASGLYFDTADETLTGSETLTFEVDYQVPFIVVAGQFQLGYGEFELRVSPGAALQSDPDDGRLLQRGRTYIGNMDFPADLDMFEIDLEAGETVTVRVETVNFDPDIALDAPDNEGDPLVYDDDSGGGLFGTDAELTFTAPTTDRYIISVADVNLEQVGGYYLIVD